MGEEYASGAKSLAGLTEGACAAQGYAVPAGGQMLNVVLQAPAALRSM